MSNQKNNDYILNFLISIGDKDIDEIKFFQSENSKIEICWDDLAKEIDWTLISDIDKLKIGRIANDCDFWRLIFRKINWSNVSSYILIEYGEEISSKFFWIKIIETKCLSTDQILSICRKQNYGDIWEAAIKTGELPREVIDEVNNNYPERDDIQEAISEQLSLMEL